MPIVAAVDQSPRAETVVEKAWELADVYDVDLHVVYVHRPSVDRLPGEVDPGHLSEGYSLGRVSRDSMVEDLEEAAEAASEVPRELADTVDGLEEFEAVGLVGDPATQLLEYAAQQDAEYIVVSGRKRSPMGQAIFGSVTQSLLLNADRPIVAVAHDPE